MHLSDSNITEAIRMQGLDAPSAQKCAAEGKNDTFTTALALPPLIVEYRSGELSIRDGNTRYGAMQLLGWHTCWVVIWYNAEADFLAHRKALA